MYRISEVATKVGLSRTALLYYEQLGLICGKRASNGYRLYSDAEVQRIKLVQQLQLAGLTLKECKSCLEAEIDRQLLTERLQQLEREIVRKQESRQLLAAMLGIENEALWHSTASTAAPDAHLQWLIKQGFNEKEALHLKWLSKNMTEHEQYMRDFMMVYQTLERWGPGCESDTAKAVALLPTKPTNALEIGCGKGLSTIYLAEHTKAQVTAVDNEQSALDSLQQIIRHKQLSESVTTVCASMTDMPFKQHGFDLVWAENSAYIIGFEKALTDWQSLLAPKGLMMVSDAVWLTEDPSHEVRDFWQREYPEIAHIDQRLVQIADAGLELIAHFTLSKGAWDNYYVPLEARVEELSEQLSSSSALADIRKEIDIYHRYFGEYGYQMFIIRKP